MSRTEQAREIVISKSFMDEKDSKIDLSDIGASDSGEGEPGKEKYFESYSGESKLAGLLIKWSGGLIQNEEQVNYLLVLLVVIMALTTAFLVFKTVERPEPRPETVPETGSQREIYP